MTVVTVVLEILETVVGSLIALSLILAARAAWKASPGKRAEMAMPIIVMIGFIAPLLATAAAILLTIGLRCFAAVMHFMGNIPWSVTGCWLAVLMAFAMVWWRLAIWLADDPALGSERAGRQ